MMNFAGLTFIFAIICQMHKIWGSSLPTNADPKSCLDYFKRGHKTNGYYHVANYGTAGIYHSVYCDMESEPGFAWTLVESFALKKKAIPAFTKHPMTTNAPVRPKAPNWNLYRMSSPQMKFLKTQSSHWRFTCDFQKTKPPDLFRDYAVATFQDFDMLSFQGRNVCKKMKYINIRGHECAECTAGWYGGALHVDSPSTGCEFTAKEGAVTTEDNFGHYYATNGKFRCTSSPDATTNLWFGGFY